MADLQGWLVPYLSDISALYMIFINNSDFIYWLTGVIDSLISRVYVITWM